MYQTGSITKAGLHSAALKKQEALSITAACVWMCKCVCVCEVQAGLWRAERGEEEEEEEEEEVVVIVCLLLSNDSGRVD